MTRTANDAYQIARRVCEAGNPDAGSRLFNRLLWHVEAIDGGFIGLTDAQLERKCKSTPGLNLEYALASMWAPGEWPSEENSERKAA